MRKRVLVRFVLAVAISATLAAWAAGGGWWRRRRWGGWWWGRSGGWWGGGGVRVAHGGRGCGGIGGCFGGEQRCGVLRGMRAPRRGTTAKILGMDLSHAGAAE